MFILAMKLAAPVMAVLILTQIGFGLMSKFAPQVNILATELSFDDHPGRVLLRHYHDFLGSGGNRVIYQAFSFS